MLRERVHAGMVAVLVLVAACGVDDRQVIDVFAAASLADAFSDVAAAYEAAHPDTDVRLNFAASSALREQLRDGATADVFVSANMAVMSELVDEGAIAGEPRIMAGNRLALAVPAANPGSVEGLVDLARQDLLVGVCARGVPCGELAAEVLDPLSIEISVDTAEADAGALVARLAEGELDAGFVYASDVAGSGGKLVSVGPDFQAATDYPIAVVPGSPQPDADSFVDFVLGPQGREILDRWGFVLP